jgi:hypothetical protein
MKKLKVFYNGVYLRDIYPHATKWEITKYRFARGIRVLGIQAVIALALLTSHQIGQVTVEPIKVYADKIVEVDRAKVFPQILEKICKAESGSRQFNKNGSVLRGKENPSDIGYCQISEVIWNDTARKLGYDIYTEQGNKDMAVWLLEHYGSEPWFLSKHNWK